MNEVLPHQRGPKGQATLLETRGYSLSLAALTMNSKAAADGT